MKHFNIYLSGGMTDMSPEEQITWRLVLIDKFKKYDGQYDVDCFNPYLYYSERRPEEYESEREVMEYDLYKLRHADLVIVNFNNSKSLGTMSEIAIAYDRQIPIIGLHRSNNKLHPWQKDMCNKIFNNINELAEYVKNYYLS